MIFAHLLKYLRTYTITCSLALLRRTCLLGYLRTGKHLRKYTCEVVHLHALAYLITCASTCSLTSLHTCASTCELAYSPTCVLEHLRNLHTCACTYASTCASTCTLAQVHTCVHAHLRILIIIYSYKNMQNYNFHARNNINTEKNIIFYMYSLMLYILICIVLVFIIVLFLSMALK